VEEPSVTSDDDLSGAESGQGGSGGRGPRSLADRINQLFASIHPVGRGPYSEREVVDWLAEHGADGPTISRNYLHWLRTGERDNPTVDHLRAIARFFGVSPSYLLEDDNEDMHRDLEFLAALKEQDIRTILLRAREMTPEMRSWLAKTVSEMPIQQSTSRRSRSPRPTSDSRD
jgi:transcriptional regulator with XRE-family HTH domain